MFPVVSGAPQRFDEPGGDVQRNIESYVARPAASELYARSRRVAADRLEA